MRSLLVLILLAFCFVGYGQIINFPDPNFKNALVNTKCVDTDGDGWGDTDADLNDDGEVDLNEANMIQRLVISNKTIVSLNGINNFLSLVHLDCNKNQLTSLNVKELINLKNLFCEINMITSIDLGGLINLEMLNCDRNRLTSIDITDLPKLNSLYCRNNQISSVKLKGLTNFEALICPQNKIKSIDLVGLPNLMSLDCNNNQITSLNLIGFNNLKYLDCSFNRITSLELKGFTKLEYLYCTDNLIFNLDLQGLNNLTNFYCYNNQVTSLDCKEFSNLKHFHCTKNNLTSLNVQELKNLVNLSCASNQLTFIDLQGLTDLKSLDCTSNKISILDVQRAPSLEFVFCPNNKIISLNAQGLIKLEVFSCNDNQLKFLNIKGTDINDLRFHRNQDLSYICCNDDQITNIKNKAISNGQSCEVNSYCSFTPGGKFYTIQGQNTFDENNNGCDDLDIKVSKIKYNITNGTASGTFISNSTGNYSIPLQAGTHTITPIIEYPDHFEVTPTTFTVTFPSTSDTITQNFCITPKGIFRQTNITVIPLSPPARPGFDAQYKIVWENVGNQIESGSLNFTYDETLLGYISATQSPDQVADGIVKWNFSNLLPFEKREITVTLKVNRPTDTPAVNAGDKLYLTASILDNIFTFENTVVGSYDPNDKTCLQGDRVKPDMVGKYVDYLIRYENTGNYAAENVVIKDIIDTKTFDVSSLQITDASHEVYTRIEGNKVEFIFENIQLPFDNANNDGYVAFKIKTLPTLVLGDSLKNLADIYFDYNFPIRTNEAQTTIALPSFTKDIANEVNIYPNPVRDILYLESDENWSKAEIYDISGRVLRSISLEGKTIDVSGLESGTYFMRLKDGEKVGVVKFVKM